MLHQRDHDHLVLRSLCTSWHLLLSCLCAFWLSSAWLSLRLQVSAISAPRILTLDPAAPWCVNCSHDRGQRQFRDRLVESIQDRFSATYSHLHWPDRYNGPDYVRRWRESRVHMLWSPPHSSDNISPMLSHPQVDWSLQISEKLRDVSDPREAKVGFCQVCGHSSVLLVQ
jgi:hypothetical protein